MGLTRREFGLSALALGLAGCVSGGGGGGFVAAPGPAPATRMRTAPNAGFDAWLAGFRARAAGQGISETTLTRAFRDAGYLPGVIEREANQFHKRRTLEDYLAISVSDERVSNGRAQLRRQAAVLAAIEAKYRVEPHVVAAIWGVETRYGTRRGDIPVISALATLGYAGRRSGFFASELMAALRIVQAGDIAPARMTGSWAGAMGHTQFIPSSYERLAVDFDGDGRRDIWGEDPTDALASAAAYLNRSGWRHGLPWGIEVTAPEDGGLIGQTRGDWGSVGVRRATGGALPALGQATLLRPAGAAGPAFLFTSNAKAIRSYNNSQKYVIAVGHLSDRLAGGGPLRGGFAPDAAGMGIDDRKRLQNRLNAAGFDLGEPDGVIGDKTRAAIRAYQRRHGLEVTGEPSLALLRHLG